MSPFLLHQIPAEEFDRGLRGCLGCKPKLVPINLSGRVGVPPAGFGILPKQSFQVRGSRKLSESPAGVTPTLPETAEARLRHAESVL